MKQIQANLDDLVPSQPGIIHDKDTNHRVLDLIASYRTGKPVTNIELVKHPTENGYIISEGHKRAFATWKAGVTPEFDLLEGDRDKGQGYAGEMPFADYVDCLVRDADQARQNGIYKVSDYEQEFARFNPHWTP